jgi:tetratricopeptide (TPR) repeat protein
MIKNLLAFALVASSICAQAQNIKMPAPSPAQTIKQEFGIGSIELSYSRPGLKGRTIGKDIAPFGKVWRTGANQATTLTFSDEVTINGTKLPAGKYGLLSIPDQNNWTLIITKQLDVTSPAAYKQESDVVRVNARPVTLSTPVETFTIQFANIKPNSTDIQLMWGNHLVSLPVSMDVETSVMKQIDNAMNRDSRPYFQAAMYYMETGKDMNQALSWFDKAVEQQPKAFWIHHQRANALAKLGKKEDARTAANLSMQLARDAKNDDYVKLNEDLIKSLK